MIGITKMTSVTKPVFYQEYQMEVVFTRSMLEQVEDVIKQASQENRSIKYIHVTRDEMQQLIDELNFYLPVALVPHCDAITLYGVLITTEHLREAVQ
jgi:thymidine kinase